jgi:competence ComEA-like helix-hairpin-helix protein
MITFVSILLSWELIKNVFPPVQKSFTYITPHSESDHYAPKKEWTHYPRYSSKKKFEKRNYPSYQAKYSSYEDEQELVPPSSPVSISIASVDELVSMGIERKAAFHIKNFIKAGGVITSDEDLLKIYGMDSIQLVNAKPYLIYPTKQLRMNNDSIQKFENHLKGTGKVLDLNLASVEELESLDGIGISSAQRIVRFRKEAGGFINIDQLKDCNCIYPDAFEKIKNRLTLSGSPDLLHINIINLDSVAHPYLPKKMIWLIKAYKKQHGDFKDPSAIRKVYPPDSNWCNKLLPYLSFETN